MIKKIKIVNKRGLDYLRDTTTGRIYDITAFTEAGELDGCGVLAAHDSLNFTDDVGDNVAIWVQSTCYEVVEEDPSMTNNNQVNWEEIPEDVEAVVTFNNDVPSYYKTVNNKLMVQCYREDTFDNSGHGSVESAIEYFEDRWHSRPSPITQPTPVPPESTQVEISEVKDTTTPEFDWSSVEDDVEAVIIYEGECTQLLKTVEGVFKYKRVGELEYTTSCWYSTLDEREKCISHYKDGTATLIRRPPAITTPEDIELNAGYDIYKKVAAEVDKIGVDSKPSISTILQEAQQSILKHHGVTGKVKFTVTCS